MSRWIAWMLLLVAIIEFGSTAAEHVYEALYIPPLITLAIGLGRGRPWVMPIIYTLAYLQVGQYGVGLAVMARSWLAQDSLPRILASFAPATAWILLWLTLICAARRALSQRRSAPASDTLGA